ncbi:MAG: lipocalin family protein, partial [Chloroflexota bacterium]
GANGDPFQVWIEDWSAQALDGAGNVVRLQARDGEMAVDLTLQATKPVVAHGDRGLSPKSDEPGNASYYLSFTRMTTTGQVTVRGRSAAVAGESWFDHEWSTSALGQDVVGWNWFSLQLGDGRELMFYQFRLADDGIGRLSSGTLIEPDGSARRLSADEVQIQADDTWVSPETGAEYPARWRISIPSAQIELTVEPWIEAQEMQVSFVYWEGAVKLDGLSNGAAVTGNGYVELTGYKGSMKGVF